MLKLVSFVKFLVINNVMIKIAIFTTIDRDKWQDKLHQVRVWALSNSVVYNKIKVHIAYKFLIHSKTSSTKI